jgi:toxin FitB
VVSFLLDTNVVSELVRPKPESAVVTWISGHLPNELFLSAITIAELVRGVSKIPAGRRRERLRRWVNDDLQRQFQARILSFDQEAAMIWGTVMGEADRRGRPRSAIDIQIAAIAIRNGLTLVTRNVLDVEDVPVKVINPWGTR